MALLKLAKLGEKPEIFHTLQGEGVNMGVPSVFIRSSLCNLHCSWCDTAYTWNWEGTPWQHEDEQKFAKSDYIAETPVEEASLLIAKYNCHNVIITGGEPLIQQEGWQALITQLRSNSADYLFEVETNGTIKPNDFLANAVNQWNVSPKLSNSNNPETLRTKADALEFFAAQPNAWFKFVIQSQQDLDETLQLETQYKIKKERIILMPEGRDEYSLNAKRLWLADICRDLGYRFSDRLHIQLWGSKRGV